MTQEIERIQAMRRSLSSVRLRFAPEVQPAREMANDKIMQNVMFAHMDAGVIPLEQLELCSEEGCAIQAFEQEQVIQSITSLRDVRILAVEIQDGEPAHSLTNDAVDSIRISRGQAGEQLREIPGALFRDVPGGPARYQDAFTDCLCYIFAELAEESAQLVGQEATWGWCG